VGFEPLERRPMFVLMNYPLYSLELELVARLKKDLPPS
jgi:hypothetical protein